jgi:hypothetical protein
MKRQKSCGPRWGKLVHQLPGVVTFAYDLHFRCTIAHWKELSKEYTCFHHTLAKSYSVTVSHPKKRCLGPQNGPRSLGPEKL